MNYIKEAFKLAHFWDPDDDDGGLEPKKKKEESKKGKPLPRRKPRLRTA